MILQSTLKMTLERRIQALREKLALIPQKPGVYLHKGSQGEILYVGKAKNLNARLKSYFTGIEQHPPKTKALVDKIFDFEVIFTESEYESLILENNLIKHNQPTYNILLRDDKTYPFIKIDIKEDWPRVTSVRRRKKDSSLYFGPYTIAGQHQQILSIINRFFPLVKCTPSFFKSVTRPCNYYDIKKCMGPCKLPVDKEEYKKHLNAVISLLNGKYKEIIKILNYDMKIAAQNFNFEKAALLRDQISALNKLAQTQSVLLEIDCEIDIIGSHWNDDIIIIYITNIREGKVVGGISHIIHNSVEEPLEENNINTEEKKRIYTTFLLQNYENKFIPRHILFDNLKNIISDEDSKNLNKFLYQKRQDEFIFFNRTKDYLNYTKIKEKNFIKKIYDIITLTNNNAEIKFQEQVKIDEYSIKMLTNLQNVLKLESLPKKIECYDISTFQGSDTVAAQIVFVDGKQSKKDYRKYIIKDNLGKPDDFSSLRETIRRRFKDKNILPDLLIIDGGTPQIREVGWVLVSLGLAKIPLIGIAKSRIQNSFADKNITQTEERLVIPTKNENREILPEKATHTIILSPGSPEYRLITQIRNEAHRFAIQFHRLKRSKTSLQSIFKETKGLGPKRKKRLLDLYPDIRIMLELDMFEVSQKAKIPLNVIQALFEKLKNK